VEGNLKVYHLHRFGLALH